MLPLKKILWPTDFSDPAEEGLKLATELATQFSAEMLLVHVVAPLPTMHAGIAPPSIHMSSVLQEIEASAKKSFEEIQRERIPTDIQVRSFVIHGNPAHEIVSLAAQEKADIIVMATQGESGWQRFVFGSVAERVVRSANCPVLTIRPAKEEDEEQ